MAIFKFSNAGGFGTYQRYNDFLAGNPAVNLDKGSMYPLGVFTLSATQTTVEFTNIPQTYTHLQIRGIARSTRAQGGDYLGIRFNADTASNYTQHYLYGDGSSALSSGAANASNIAGFQIAANTAGSNTYGTFVMDLLDYRNTNKFKTLRLLTGYDNNGSGLLSLASGVWRSTNAVTSITFLTDASIATNSSFALYGVQA